MSPLLLATLISCKGREPYVPPAATDTISGYHGLGQDNSWIYRDDANDTPPLNNALLHALDDNGLVEIRRGARWADGEPAGSLEWDTSGGLYLIAWDLPSGATGSGSLHLTNEDLAQPGSCTLTIPEEGSGHTTYYGTYEDALIYDCDGDLPGRYVFAAGVGLIWMETDTDILNLVAPW